MLDIGWTELVVIAIVLIVVVGPKDLPPMLRAFGRMTSKLRGMASDFRQQFDEALREADLEDVRKTISDAQSLNPANALRDAMNPLRQIGNEIKSDLQKAASPDKAPVSAAEPPVSSVEPVAVGAAEAKPANSIAAAAIGSASRQMQRAEASEPAAKPKRVTKAKADATPAPKKASPAKAATAKSAPAKTAAKRPSKVEAEQPKEKTQKTRAATRKKGDV
ncbi:MULTISPECIES: Sec-independent protein translocase protein TatB [Ensifer]|jgi:sec-independent protein translocase protein TatB|uniref:Sec-independent protein translocase protein TatB n=1 Tax=Ensifer canadensis TaxID=555315 RepID=A0AAW4FI39_9HYPH|nr:MULTISPECIES: Sec-independent protein translocase protein TatB [Ensifer]AHK44270.1 putative sec-independent protein secretion pathway component TatB [Ensifer adhaerens OV14]MDP9629984.1 sec-independent protein translocase protein TatB [Ensifer adhaerens]KQU96866.1 preprotein translocase [Ensifer sp. Root31]KQW60853.1 preprotein translocase [Ensifer sp. Root1252]KQW75395.1 preprotein translocase [Ensifer sp. Root127]